MFRLPWLVERDSLKDGTTNDKSAVACSLRLKMSTVEPRDAWLLVALDRSPMDRIHLMKAMFLPWFRRGRQLPGYFDFKPYLYGPYSAQVYASLDRLQREGLIASEPAAIDRWADFRVTPEGQQHLRRTVSSLDPVLRGDIERSVDELSGLELGELLSRVYAEAPEFAVASVYAAAGKGRRATQLPQPAH
jgi:hypothetical protein